MNKYAIYFVDGVYESKDLLEIVKANCAEEAENEAYLGGIDCGGSCYDDYDEEDPDAWEPDCNCHYKVELVPWDAEDRNGRVYSEYERYINKIENAQNIMTSYPTYIERDKLEIKKLQERVDQKEWELQETQRMFGTLYEAAISYIAKMNENKED